MAAPAPSVTAAWAPGADVGRPGATAGGRTRPFRFGDRTGDEALAQRDPPLSAGELVGGRYRIVQLLGEGGMGRVYEAQHVVLGHRVAVKLLRRERGSAEHHARFRQEADAAARIGHRAIVGVSDFGGRDEPHAYMVMELLRGESLESWLSRPGRLRDGIEYVVEVARGLQAAHTAGVVHRDLKPANLFLHRNSDGHVQPKILDFGIAKLASTEHTAIATAAGTVLGTPYYIAPERALGRPLDARADLYSLGVILYEIATGMVPFVDETFMGVLAKHVRVAPLDPRQAAPDRAVPDGLARLVMSLLAKDPLARPASAEAVALELERLLDVERDAIAPGVTGPREGGTDATATVHIDEIAERPTSVPGERVHEADTVVPGVASSGASQVAAPIAFAGQAAPTRALGSNAMRDGLPLVRAEGRSSAIALAAVVIAIGGLAGWWIAARSLRTDLPPTAAAASPDAPASIGATSPNGVAIEPTAGTPEGTPRVGDTASIAGPIGASDGARVARPSEAPATPSDTSATTPGEPVAKSRPAARPRKPKPKSPASSSTAPTPPAQPGASTPPPLKD